MSRNFILQTDSYKVAHSQLYPSDLTNLYAYYESRGGKWEHTIFFGLQYYLREYLSPNLFYDAFDKRDIENAKLFCSMHFGNENVFNEAAWRALLEDHDGFLPLRIKALPEGSLVPTHTPLFTVENTDPKYPWLTTYVETTLMKVWYPITIATQSFYLRVFLENLFDKYTDGVSAEFAVHDFSYRGCTSEEQAAIGGAAHLLSFRGSDTMAGISMLRENYDLKTKMYGYSIPATEHSVILAHETEEGAFKHLLHTFPQSMVACVSDTYNIYNAVENLWGGSLREEVSNRPQITVIRPDSGDPQEVVSQILHTLSLKFGYTVNSKGMMVLDNVRVIQGDGMNYESIQALYENIISFGFSPENLTIGAGGGMMQGVNRDTQRFAYKVSSLVRGGKRIDVAKSPIGDPSKKSKKGRFAVYHDGVDYRTSTETVENDLLEVVFDGIMQKGISATDIIERVEKNIVIAPHEAEFRLEENSHQIFSAKNR